jgi:molybdopterin-guanine dinucleotide biosynthesis protein A
MKNPRDIVNSHTSLITGLILAGGQGRRAGGRDKGLLTWQGKTLAAHTVERVHPQVKTLLISCNRNQQEYDKLAVHTVSDLRDSYQGPLAGLESSIEHVQTDYLLLVACDLPAVPEDLGSRLFEGLQKKTSQDSNICVAWDGEREQYLCALIRRSALHSLTEFLDSGGRAVRHWYQEQGYTLADFSDCPHSFKNVNRVE